MSALLGLLWSLIQTAFTSPQTLLAILNTISGILDKLAGHPPQSVQTALQKADKAVQDHCDEIGCPTQIKSDE